MPKEAKDCGSQFFLTCFGRPVAGVAATSVATRMISDSDWFDTCHFFCFACSWLSWSYWVFRLRCWGSRSHWSYRMDWIYRTYWINWRWLWFLLWLRFWSWFSSSTFSTNVLLPKIEADNFFPALFTSSMYWIKTSVSGLIAPINFVSRKTEKPSPPPYKKSLIIAL